MEQNQILNAATLTSMKPLPSSCRSRPPATASWLPARPATARPKACPGQVGDLPWGEPAARMAAKRDIHHPMLANAECQPFPFISLEAGDPRVDLVYTRRKERDGVVSRFRRQGLRFDAGPLLSGGDLGFGDGGALGIVDLAAECAAEFLPEERCRGKQGNRGDGVNFGHTNTP